MTRQTFRISGQVINVKTRRGAAGLRIEAWAQDTRSPNPLGTASTNSGGFFEISLDESHFGHYTPNELPGVSLKVFRDGEPVESRENAVLWNMTTGEVGVVERDTPFDVSESTEVGIHELGESIAATAANTQQELARYPNALGAFVLDEIDLNIPTHLRIDSLGQVMAIVVKCETPSSTITQLRLRLRPVLSASQPFPTIAGQPLIALVILSPDTVARLEEYRIFSVADLLRVARNASGRAALAKLDLGADLDSVLDRAAVLSLPMLPAPVAEILLQIGIESPADFTKRDAATLAESISERLDQRISPEDVRCWQQEVNEAIAVPLPECHFEDREEKAGSELIERGERDG